MKLIVRLYLQPDKLSCYVFVNHDSLSLISAASFQPARRKALHRLGRLLPLQKSLKPPFLRGLWLLMTFPDFEGSSFAGLTLREYFSWASQNAQSLYFQKS